jgi:UDP-3-O-[3-hydroxymyristoyl] glucosamine N-acyltransferase
VIQLIDFNVSKFNSNYNFFIKGVSNAQYPKSNTMLFAASKLSKHLINLHNVEECLVFIEKEMSVDKNLFKRHCIVESINPALEYILTVTPFVEKLIEENRGKKYRRTSEGYLLGEDVKLGKNIFIEPECLIDHGSVIGDNTVILSGAIIRGNVIIGNKCIIREKANIGGYGFTMAKDQNDNNIRIPSLGGVRIGDNVEIGAFATICSGTGNPTVIENYVKIDDHVHVSHDDFIGKNSILSAGSILAGYVEIGEHVHISAGASIKNRIRIGSDATIGMAARIYKDVKEGQTVLNAPAVTLDEMAQRKILLNKLR